VYLDYLKQQLADLVYQNIDLQNLNYVEITDSDLLFKIVVKDPEDFYNCLEANVDEIVGYYLPEFYSVTTR